MQELVRKHEVFSVNGKTRKVRILRESGDLLEGVQRFLKVPLVLNSVGEWKFFLEENHDESESLNHFRAKALCQEEETPFYYDFAVEETAMKNRFINAVEVISGRKIEEVL